MAFFPCEFFCCVTVPVNDVDIRAVKEQHTSHIQVAFGSSHHQGREPLGFSLDINIRAIS